MIASSSTNAVCQRVHRRHQSQAARKALTCCCQAQQQQELSKTDSTMLQPSRRQLLAGSALVGLSSVSGSATAAEGKACLVNTSANAKANLGKEIPTAALNQELRISRIIKGCWPVPGTPAAASNVNINALVKAGVTTFDTGDVDDGQAELTMGRWLASRSPEDRARVQVLAKLSVTDIFDMATVDRGIINQELSFKVRDLGSPPDMVQFYWGTWKQPKWLDAVKWLADEQAAGRFKHLGLVNWDAEQLNAVLNAGIKVAAVQVPYSLIDRRPETALLSLCRQQSVPVLAMSPLAGGLISGGYLGMPADKIPANYVSLKGKYGRLLREAGETEWLQQLLAVLATIGTRHGVTPATVATRWVLDQPGVAGVVRPARTATPEAITGLASPFKFTLDASDRALINEVLELSVRPSGGVYDYERGLGPFW